MTALSAPELWTLEGAETDAFTADVLAGLARRPKQIPCKYFYDARGSELFEAITRLEEYYPTRTEMAIMLGAVDEIAAAIGERALVIEFGSGSSTKTRLLLERLERTAGYVPIDIAREQLQKAAEELRIKYPELRVAPVCADYTEEVRLPELNGAARRVCYFPGSTIGNFTPTEAVRFLRGVARMCGKGGMLLIGVDLKKDPAVITRAYNDTAGVTAEFNLNLLARANREAGADFDVGAFDHHAFYDPKAGCIEMHLVSRGNQNVCVAGRTFELAKGETIWTESSYKYTVDEFVALASGAGWRENQMWGDDQAYFGVMLFEI